MTRRSPGRRVSWARPCSPETGLLAWYSLIHLDADGLREALPVLRHVLVPGGTLLLSFFAGPRVEPIDHPVAPAYRMPITVVTDELAPAGYTVLDRTSSDLHAAILAHAR